MLNNMITIKENIFTEELTKKGLFFPKGEYKIRIINRLKVIEHLTISGLYFRVSEISK